MSLFPRSHHVGSQSPVSNGGTVETDNYTFGIFGNAVGLRFISPVSASLAKVYFYVSIVPHPFEAAFDVQLMDLSGSSISVPGGTIHTSTTVNSASDASWYQAINFSPDFTLVQGRSYFLILSYSNLTPWSLPIERGATLGNLSTELNPVFAGFKTTDGWQTSSSSGTLPIVLKFSDGTILGNPYVNDSGDEAISTQVGLKFDNLPINVTLSHIFSSDTTNLLSVKVYDEPDSPIDTPITTIDIGNNAEGFIDLNEIIIEANTVKRVVLEYYLETQIDQLTSNGASSLSEVLSTQFFQGYVYLTYQDGYNWVDNTWMFPAGQWVFKDIGN